MPDERQPPDPEPEGDMTTATPPSPASDPSGKEDPAPIDKLAIPPREARWYQALVVPTLAVLTALAGALQLRAASVGRFAVSLPPQPGS